MAEILIKPLSSTQFEVTVNARQSTVHIVNLSENYVQTLTAGKISTEALLKKSFEFLLAREPNTSILRQFELSVISRYFPDYESQIRNA